jgi:hypothetical protein
VAKLLLLLLLLLQLCSAVKRICIVAFLSAPVCVVFALYMCTHVPTATPVFIMADFGQFWN